MLKQMNRLLFSLGLLLVSGQALAILIQDTYIGSNDHGYGDRIGNSSYEVYNLDVTFNGDVMTVRVNTNFNQATDPYGIQFGDLFISTNGWNPYGSAPYRSDNAANGEDWEYVFDTSARSLYGGAFGIYTSDHFLDPNRYIFRNGQEVQRSGGGNAIGGSTVDLLHAGVGGYIEYNILLSSLGITDSADIGLKWGMTCANDTIEGNVHVPEPATLLLFGLGLLGLGATARKRTN